MEGVSSDEESFFAGQSLRLIHFDGQMFSPDTQLPFPPVTPHLYTCLWVFCFLAHVYLGNLFLCLQISESDRNLNVVNVHI